MRFRYCAIVALMFVFPFTVSAQSGSISGKITDNNGDALPGANVTAWSSSA